MRRSITIIASALVALIVIVGGAVGLRAAREQIAADRTSAGAPQAAPVGSDAQYHELAERLLNFGYGPAGPMTITLLPAALPTDPAITLPTVTGARLVGSAVRVIGTGRSADIVIDAPGDPQQVAAAYEQGFTDQGWSVPSTPTGVSVATPGGFQASTPPVSKQLCKGETAMLSVVVSARPGAPNDVRINLQPNLANVGGTACSAKSRQPGGGNHLPPLRPPDGATLLGGGGGSSMSSIGGGPGLSRQTSETTATTTFSAGALEAAFEKQLAAAGWTRLAGRDDGALAWSTWTSNEVGWSGTLIVSDTATKDQRSLLLRAEGPAN